MDIVVVQLGAYESDVDCAAADITAMWKVFETFDPQVSTVAERGVMQKQHRE